MCPSLCDWPQQMNKAFIPTSLPRSLCASNQNMLHCHQSGARRERDLTPRLIPSISSHAGHTTSNARRMDHIQAHGRRLWVSCTAECLDASQWKVCCGQSEPQSWQDTCQDVCPFRSRLATVALKMLISSVRAQRNVLHFQGMLTAVFTFPFARYSSLPHSQTFTSSKALSKWSKISYYLQFHFKASCASVSAFRKLRSNLGTLHTLLLHHRSLHEQENSFLYCW